MLDALYCPVCLLKLRTSHLANKYLHAINKTADYAERVCTKGHNHALLFYADKSTGLVDLMKLSLNSSYSRFLEIDFVNHTSKILCLKNGKTEFLLELDKRFQPDFPHLTKLKETVSLCLTFS